MPDGSQLGAIDRAFHHAARRGESSAAHAAVEFVGTLDGERLASTLHAMCEREAMLRARVVDDDAARWQFDLAPLIVQTFDAADDRDVASLQQRFFDEPLDPAGALLRVGHVRAPGGDRLLLLGSHVGLDGLSLLAVGLELAQAASPAAVSSAPAAADGPASVPAFGAVPTQDEVAALEQLLRARVPRRSVRVAGVDGGHAPDRLQVAVGEIDQATTERLLSHRRDGRSSLVALLAAAVARAIAVHNAHDSGPTYPITMCLPVNLRPPGSLALGNFAYPWPLVVEEQHDDAELIADLATQLDELRSARRCGAFAAVVADQTARRLPAPWAVRIQGATTFVSHLGELPVDLGSVRRVVASTCAPPPQHVSIVTYVVDGRLHVAIRFGAGDSAACRSFAARVFESVDAIAGWVDRDAERVQLAVTR